MLHYFTDALIGPTQARAAHGRNLMGKPGIRSGLSYLQHACQNNKEDDPEKPIFLLSAGWRSGSTLLQRMIMSDRRVLIWGEPFDECGTIQALADTVKAFRQNWPPNEYFYDGSPPNELTDEWIANLFPSIEALKASHRTFFDNLLLLPAKSAGAERWGIKEVRLTSDHCYYLRWLYPNSRFVFLYRNPFDAYASYCSYGRSWYNVFPHKPVLTPTTFGEHWKLLMEGFLEDADELGALLIKYEDLVEGRVAIETLEEHLQISIDRSVLRIKVGGSQQTGRKTNVNRLETYLLKRAIAPVAKQLGYCP